MSTMGLELENFDVPVCNSFKDKILNSQQCYEVDPNQYIKSRSQIETSENLRVGLIFLMDYNEDRQINLVNWEQSNNRSRKDSLDLFKSFSDQFNEEKSDIYVQTIGNSVFSYFMTNDL